MAGSESRILSCRHFLGSGNGRILPHVHGCSAGTEGVTLDAIMVGTWMLCGNGQTLSGRYHGWHMDASWERTESVGTLSWLAHGCFVGKDGVCLDAIMVGTWMLRGNGRTLSGRYHGCHGVVGTAGVCLDVIMVTTWMLCGNGRSLCGRCPWLEHGCSAGRDGVSLGITMVGTWMLCGNGRSWSGRYHGWHMDGVTLDGIMVGTWMLCGNGRTLSGRVSWLAHGCFVGTDGLCLDVIMVGRWMLCGNGRSLSGRYHGWHMDALWERTDFVWTLSWLAHGCFVGTAGTDGLERGCAGQRCPWSEWGVSSGSRAKP